MLQAPFGKFLAENTAYYKITTKIPLSDRCMSGTHENILRSGTNKKSATPEKLKTLKFFHRFREKTLVLRADSLVSSLFSFTLLFILMSTFNSRLLEMFLA